MIFNMHNSQIARRPIFARGGSPPPALPQAWAEEVQRVGAELARALYLQLSDLLKHVSALEAGLEQLRRQQEAACSRLEQEALARSQFRREVRGRLAELEESLLQIQARHDSTLCSNIQAISEL
jgi:hypothetical protein